jgi:hypothetical protein
LAVTRGCPLPVLIKDLIAFCDHFWGVLSRSSEPCCNFLIL